MNTDILQIALSKYGLKETPGAADNPEILAMAKECGFTDYIHDSTAWCSLFANWVALKAGYQRSKSLAARSWLVLGTPITAPEIGDVVVLWRDNINSGLGHVGFFIRATDDRLWLLAGNQGDEVCIEDFDIRRLMGYRRLAKV